MVSTTMDVKPLAGLVETGHYGDLSLPLFRTLRRDQ